MPVKVRIVWHASIYVWEEVVTLGKQKDRIHMKFKTNMSAIKLAAFLLCKLLLVWLYGRPVELQAVICQFV